MSTQAPNGPWWARPLATLQSALPLLLLAGAAGYTWWLVQSMPGDARARSSNLPATEPDYVLERAQVERFDAAGRRISLLQGQVMSHFEQGDRLEVQALQLAAQDALGRHLHAQAREGRYEGATSVVDLLGSARVTATPAAGLGGASAGLARGPLTFEGEALRIDVDAQVLSSNRAVLLRSPQGQMRGGSLNYQAKAGLGTLGGRVQGSFRGGAQ